MRDNLNLTQLSFISLSGIHRNTLWWHASVSKMIFPLQAFLDFYWLIWTPPRRFYGGLITKLHHQFYLRVNEHKLSVVLSNTLEPPPFKDNKFSSRNMLIISLHLFSHRALIFYSSAGFGFFNYGLILRFCLRVEEMKS